MLRPAAEGPVLLSRRKHRLDRKEERPGVAGSSSRRTIHFVVVVWYFMSGRGSSLVLYFGVLMGGGCCFVLCCGASSIITTVCSGHGGRTSVGNDTAALGITSVEYPVQCREYHHFTNPKTQNPHFHPDCCCHFSDEHTRAAIHST